MHRPDLSDRLLIVLVAVTLAVIAAYFLVIQPFLPVSWRTPGSPPLYLAGVAGTLLLLVSLVFVVVKRGGGGRYAQPMFIAHVVAALIGAVLIAVHSAGSLSRPPALMLLVIAVLAVLGVWARVRLSRRISRTFASREGSFARPDAPMRDALAALIERKRSVLETLDPEAREATFSPNLGHWLRRPRLAFAYWRLAHEEESLIGTRRAAGPGQGYWRALHMLLAYGLVIGILIHVVVVTFFAGYAADYGDIYWWHITDW